MKTTIINSLRSIFAAGTLFLIAAGLAPVAMAGNEISEQIEEAQRALDEAAKRLAELHARNHAEHPSKKKAMLGVLLGDGPMIGGVPLVGTTPNGGAAQAGIQAGDKILAIGDVSLEEVDDPMRTLATYMKSVEPGDTVGVVYERDGQRISADIVTQGRSAHIMKLIGDDLDDLKIDLEAMGLDAEIAQAMALSREITTSIEMELPFMDVEGDLASYFDIESGVVVITLDEDSQLRGGDVLLAIDGNEVDDARSALQELTQLQHETEVRVLRRSKERNITVTPEEFELKKEVRVIRVPASSFEEKSKDD